jgi:hypothetical protein
MNTRAAAEAQQFDPAKGPISVIGNPSNLSQLDQKTLPKVLDPTVTADQLRELKMGYLGEKFKANNIGAGDKIALTDRGANQIEGFVAKMEAQSKSRDGGRGGVA